MAEALNTASNELFKQYDWFCSGILPKIQQSSDEFVYEGLQFKLVSLSKNMNAMFQDDSYFVTKVKVDAQNEVYIRCSDKAASIILDKSLGKSAKPFHFKDITDLEAKLITSYNDSLYNRISKYISAPIQQAKKDFDVTHLTFFVRNINENFGGKIILSIPTPLLAPVSIASNSEKFTVDYFSNSLLETNIKIGSTIFTVKDLKSLEPDDIVVLEYSNIQMMRLDYKGYEKDFRIAPNPALIISVDNSGGEDMSENIAPENLWDSIQVEMGAEFEKVKISLGELKNIEQGLVVDISSVYNNNITLKVEEKVIATGELVIVNDRYGVKINHVFAAPQPAAQVQEQIPQQQSQPQPQVEVPATDSAQDEQVLEDDEDFDYSDFELDDEDI